MNLRKLILTNNACYKAGRTITPKGIMVHSTGANNPNLKRYVGPDDGLLGKNQYGNHWNQDTPDGRQVCVHGFIGKLADGSVATYQTLPWNYRGWHCGASGNDTHISFEICEDGLTDSSYFNAVYKEAAELCAYLCKQYGLTEKNIICHSEGYKLGIASNHSDVMHWFPKHGKSMDTFRAEVAKLLAGGSAPAPAPAPSPAGKSVGEIAAEVIAGKWGNGSDRQTRLAAAGYDYATVQARVNAILSGSASTPAPVPAAPSPPESLYRVRKAWADAATQKGAFSSLANAKKCADANPGYSVFDQAGTKIYGGASDAAYETYVVVKGDSLWKIAATRLGNGSRYPEIKSLNGLTSDTIFAGQRLKVPKK
jgi:LysM repeat protein